MDYSHFLDHTVNGPVFMATIIETRGSARRVSGANAIVSSKGMVPGMPKGGIPEAGITFLLKRN